MIAPGTGLPLLFVQEVKDFTTEWQSAFAILFMVLLLACCGAR